MAAEPKKPSCFVIAPIGDEQSEVRKRSDQILTHIIIPACEIAGAAMPIRADHIAKSGIITSQVIQHLINDDLVVADLTDHNPNVFYELAIRHAFRKPVVQMIREGQELPFDVAAVRTIFFSHTDLDSAARAKAELAGHLKELIADPSLAESPVSTAVDLAQLSRSGNKADRHMAAILEGIGSIRSALHSVNERIDVLEQRPYLRRADSINVIRPSDVLPTTAGEGDFYTTVNLNRLFRGSPNISTLSDDSDPTDKG